MEEECPICKSNSLDDDLRQYGVFRCLYCKHFFRLPRTFDYSYYKDNNYWIKDDEYLSRIQKMFFSFFEDDIYLNENSSSIEVGAADGHFLSYLNAKQKHNIYYNELEDLLSTKYDFVKRKYICPAEDINNDFDNVFMIDVIEHFKNVYFINKLLKKRGKLYIATDSAMSISAEVLMIHHPEHFNIFSQKSLEILANKLNLKVNLYYDAKIIDKTFAILEK